MEGCERPEPKKKVTRRDFLTLVGALTGVAVANEVVKPIERISGIFGDFVESAGEGNVIQRKAVFDRITREIELDPTNHEKIEVLVSWLKFNGAEYYGSVSGEPTAALLVRHFLYGDGTTIDITDQYSQSWLDFYRLATTRKMMNEDPSPDLRPVVSSTEEALRLCTERSLTNRFLYGFEHDPPISTEITKLSEGRVRFGAVVGAYDDSPSRENPDIWRALHYYTVSLEGRPVLTGPMVFDTSLSTKPDGKLPDYYEVRMGEARFRLFDRYDFADSRKTHMAYVSDVIKSAVVAMGWVDEKRLVKLVGREQLSRIYDMPLTIGHGDGIRLVKHGYAKEFDVTGEKVLKNCSFYVPKDAIQRSILN